MLLRAEDSLLLLVDLQASLMPKIIETKRVTAVTNKLVSVARELSVPILMSEQYPEGLKPTIPSIADHLGESYQPISKTVFSCYGSEECRRALEESGRRTLVIVGIETHICVLQTVIQSLEAKYTVFVVADGVGARSRLDHDIALDRMVRAGAHLVTWEMVVYEWLRRADSPEFKKVLPHVKSGLDTES